jgi:hypothetical protein
MIIGSEKRYTGTSHRGLTGERVKIVAVHRGEQILDDDAAIGALRPTDTVEVRPWLDEKDRFSWVSYDAKPDELADL